jgi:hypothetical protein
MKNLTVPKFASEAEEAAWWDQHLDIVEQNLIEAMESGRATPLSQTEYGPRVIQAAKRALAAREAARTLLAKTSEEDRTRIHEAANKAGIDDETYLQQLFLKPGRALRPGSPAGRIPSGIEVWRDRFPWFR